MWNVRSRGGKGRRIEVLFMSESNSHHTFSLGCGENIGSGSPSSGMISYWFVIVHGNRKKEREKKVVVLQLGPLT
ncbi:hypothetical protein BDV34DRAFT_194176, partial [Aspergillus parasiticus]